MRIRVAAVLAALLAARTASAAPAVIVDWGGPDYVTHDSNVRGYDTPVEYDVDLGGGFTGARWYCPFSDTLPLTPSESVGHGQSWRFFGGVLLHAFGNAFEYHWAEIWAAGQYGGNQLYYGAPEGTHGWDLRYWKQIDFLGGGAGGTVRFAPGSRLEILGYQGGDGVPANNSGRVRFVVRDGAQFWISETFGPPAATPDASFVLDEPAGERWAGYDPTPPYGLRFDAAAATFAPHTFTDVTAVGYLHSNDDVAPPAVGKKAGFTCVRVRVTAEVTPAGGPGALTARKLACNARFDVAGRDACSTTLTLHAVPAGFAPAGRVLTVDVAGAGTTFTLDAAGRATTADGSRVRLHVPAGFAGGDVPLSVRMRAGDFAAAWLDDGVDPALTVQQVPLTIPLAVGIDGTPYAAAVPALYTGTAGRRGKFRRAPG